MLDKKPLRSIRWVLALLIVFLLASNAILAQEARRKVIARTAPTYPELAKKAHLTGKVKIEVVVNPAGTVTAAKPVGGSPIFENSALEAVKQWKFEAAQTTTKTVIVLEFADQ